MNTPDDHRCFQVLSVAFNEELIFLGAGTNDDRPGMRRGLKFETIERWFFFGQCRLDVFRRISSASDNSFVRRTRKGVCAHLFKRFCRVHNSVI